MNKQERNYPTRMHEVLGVEAEERFTYSEYGDKKFWLSESGLMYCVNDDGTSIPTTQWTLVFFINHPEHITRKPRPGCWYCWNIEVHKIEYVTAVKDKDGRPINTPVDIPYRYCPSCGRKLEAQT